MQPQPRLNPFNTAVRQVVFSEIVGAAITQPIIAGGDDGKSLLH